MSDSERLSATPVSATRPRPAPPAFARRSRWIATLLLTALGGLALVGRNDLRETAAFVRAAPPVCSGPAAPPHWALEIDAADVAFLTSEPDPLRSEQFFCLQYLLLPRVLHRPTLAAPEAPIGFGPARPAVVFAASSEARDRLLARLATEAGRGVPRVRAESGGWSWLEVSAP